MYSTYSLEMHGRLTGLPQPIIDLVLGKCPSVSLILEFFSFQALNLFLSDPTCSLSLSTTACSCSFSCPWSTPRPPIARHHLLLIATFFSSYSFLFSDWCWKLSVYWWVSRDLPSARCSFYCSDETVWSNELYWTRAELRVSARFSYMRSLIALLNSQELLLIRIKCAR